MLRLERITRTDPRILKNMEVHYSQPKGFVGRNICYAVLFNDEYYGSIVGGSATLHLAGRDEFFCMDKEDKAEKLTRIANNLFFHIEKINGKYPVRWFSAAVLSLFRQRIVEDWELKYGDRLIGYESLVELPRAGDCYRKDGWTLVGETKGFTCKRGPGKGTDSWSGKRTWDVKNLRPKLVFCREVEAPLPPPQKPRYNRAKGDPMTTTRRRRSPPPPPPLPNGVTPAPLSGSASPSLTGALEHEVPVAEQEVPVPEPAPVPETARGLQAQEIPTPNEAPASAPVAETAEIATVRTRYPHPLFIASQHKVVSPGEEVPVIVDSWVRHHLNHPNGALVRV